MMDACTGFRDQKVADKKWLFTECRGMKLWPCEVSPRGRANNRLRHRAFHGEAVASDEKLYTKILQYCVKDKKIDSSTEKQVSSFTHPHRAEL